MKLPSGLRPAVRFNTTYTLRHPLKYTDNHETSFASIHLTLYDAGHNCPSCEVIRPTSIFKDAEDDRDKGDTRGEGGRRGMHAHRFNLFWLIDNVRFADNRLWMLEA